MQAKLAHARCNSHVGSFFNQLSACDERVPWRTTFLLVCDGRLRLDALITIVRWFSPFSAAHPVTILKLRLGAHSIGPVHARIMVSAILNRVIAFKACG
jgi:hypothetical protein